MSLLFPKCKKKILKFNSLFTSEATEFEDLELTQDHMAGEWSTEHKILPSIHWCSLPFMALALFFSSFVEVYDK